MKVQIYLHSKYKQPRAIHITSLGKDTLIESDKSYELPVNAVDMQPLIEFERDNK